MLVDLNLKMLVLLLICACAAIIESNETIISLPQPAVSKWRNKYDEPVEPPMMCNSFEEALRFYGSVYNSAQDGQLPPTIGLPSRFMNDPILCMLLSAASEAASKRTKEQLLHLRSYLDFEFQGANVLDGY
jgi:hypothetical protein